MIQLLPFSIDFACKSLPLTISLTLLMCLTFYILERQIFRIKSLQRVNQILILNYFLYKWYVWLLVFYNYLNMWEENGKILKTVNRPCFSLTYGFQKTVTCRRHRYGAKDSHNFELWNRWNNFFLHYFNEFELIINWNF